VGDHLTVGQRTIPDSSHQTSVFQAAPDEAGTRRDRTSILENHDSQPKRRDASSRVSHTGLAPSVLRTLRPSPIVVIDLHIHCRRYLCFSFTRQQLPSSSQTIAADALVVCLRRAATRMLRPQSLGGASSGEWALATRRGYCRLERASERSFFEPTRQRRAGLR
jgi:hypothetical protein